MRALTPAGELPLRWMTFPDGQRHVELLAQDDGGFRVVTVETSLPNMATVGDLLLLKDVLDHNGYVTHLNVRYLTGARMDRRINARSPATLRVISRLLLGAGFRTIRILDPHSAVSCNELNAIAVYPTGIVDRVLSEYDPVQTVVIAPDAGAAPRVDTLLRAIRQGDLFDRVGCFKRRDPDTGKLSGFGVSTPERVAGKTCLILDDICDGGGTFVGLAAELRKAGATRVDLFVTHGLFSKGLPLAGVDHVYTTDSYQRLESESGLTVFPVEMGLSR